MPSWLTWTPQQVVWKSMHENRVWRPSKLPVVFLPQTQVAYELGLFAYHGCG